MKRTYFLLAILFCLVLAEGHSQHTAVSSQDTLAESQHTVVRRWNEILLDHIRGDFARPTVHARNLYHLSAAMYDAWAIYDDIATPHFMGKEVDGHDFVLEEFYQPIDIESARKEAISFAAYRLLDHRFKFSPEGYHLVLRMDSLMTDLGYDKNNLSTDYAYGKPANLGNYIAHHIIQYGLKDGSNEQSGYTNLYYQPINKPLIMVKPGNPDVSKINRWQPLTLELNIGQGGHVIHGTTLPFLSPEWGRVKPFAMDTTDLEIKQREGHEWYVYNDPGPPPMMSAEGNDEMSDLFRRGFEMVAVWSSHLDPKDTTMIDISPASIGNISDYPSSFADYENFYNFFDGGDASQGHALNPSTHTPYTPQMVKRSDYARVLAEFWADGPESETPPGHWFTILNYVMDHPDFVRTYKGKGEVLDPLEYEVKAYLMLGGAMHDSAISAWGIKGYYDYLRPVSAIRTMADKGQKTDPSLPSYHPQGFDLIPGYIELVKKGDPLAIADSSNIDEIKLYTWKGPSYIGDPETDAAGVGWILAKDWWPFQRPTFVSPNFSGFLSGHSTFSSAAAEVLSFVTGSPFFPGGMGEFVAEANEFLEFEEGPTETITLQWATYKDASEQTSLSRIWGGIHPPADDIPGRLIGTKVAKNVADYTEDLFFAKSKKGNFFSRLFRKFRKE